MPKFPLVSVVMPVHNGARYLREALDSILNQTYENIEFIIIDDGSTDESWSILEAYVHSDNRIKTFRHQQNMGLAHSLNRGFAISEGEYIARMDSDDISFPNRIELQVDFMEQHTDYAIVGSKTELIFNNKKPSGIIPLTFTSYEALKVGSFFYCPFAHPTVMIRKSMIPEQPYHPEIYVEDYYLWNQILEQYPCANLNQVLLYYRMHSNQFTQSKKEKQLDALSSIFKEKFNSLNIPISNQELETHLLIPGSNPQKLNPQQLNSINNWLAELQDRLLSNNLSNRIHSKIILEKVWEQVCKKGKHNGLKTYNIYKKGQFYSNNKNQFFYYFLNSPIFSPIHHIYLKIKHG